MQDVTFNVVYCSLNIVPLIVIQVAACTNFVPFFIAEQYFTCVLHHNLFTFTFMGHLGSFQFKVIMNIGAMDICVQVFVWM